ncbi:MAG: hypothetical protein E5Y67_16370 [Mesorhizobium sp.]|uniref:hypothetical protein n=1 Tax=Mesorhizobium sp. TaxID=1871066 RepID=UPI0012103F28|nr:hypothetical protein [Mesorhizobium sp.]TIM13663.1 MAG: hypothetical protein E5Y67_16370 [Mesorhizobium sp.]
MTAAPITHRCTCTICGKPFLAVVQGSRTPASVCSQRCRAERVRRTGRARYAARAKHAARFEDEAPPHTETVGTLDEMAQRQLGRAEPHGSA